MWFDCHDQVPVCCYRTTLTLAAASVPEWSVALCGWLDYCDDKHPLRSSRLRIAASQPIRALTAKLCPALPQSPHPRYQFIRASRGVMLRVFNLSTSRKTAFSPPSPRLRRIGFALEIHREVGRRILPRYCNAPTAGGRSTEKGLVCSSTRVSSGCQPLKRRRSQRRTLEEAWTSVLGELTTLMGLPTLELWQQSRG
jgi:hypothetical protein